MSRYLHCQIPYQLRGESICTDVIWATRRFLASYYTAFSQKQKRICKDVNQSWDWYFIWRSFVNKPFIVLSVLGGNSIQSTHKKGPHSCCLFDLFLVCLYVTKILHVCLFVTAKNIAVVVERRCLSNQTFLNKVCILLIYLI